MNDEIACVKLVENSQFNQKQCASFFCSPPHSARPYDIH